MFSSLRQLVQQMHTFLRAGRPSKAGEGRPRAHPLRLEHLEERQAPAVWTVTNLLDGVAGSLRAEVFQAQDGDTIQFADGLSGQITLVAGEIDITHSVDIEGPGADVIRISGNQQSRVFNVSANHTVTIAGLTIADGLVAGANGGGILNTGTLTLNECAVSGNSITFVPFNSGAGGGAYNTGTLTLEGCTFTDDTTAGDGGGIWNSGSLTIDGSSIDQDTSNYPGGLNFDGGGGIWNGARLSVTDSDISGNTATAYGGGLHNERGATANLTGCTISANQSAQGGGVYNIIDARLTVTNSTLSGNRVVSGGSGGGIYSLPNELGETRDLIVTGSTLASNSAVLDGGGIACAGDAAALTNDTLVGNVAAYGGGLFNQDTGRGTVGLTVVDCTLSGNSASSNGGGIDEAGATPTTTALANTIIAGNTSASGNDLFGSVLPTSAYNLVGDGHGSNGLIDGINGNQVGFYSALDPLLGPLQDNGGASWTMALLPGSPALNAGDPGQLGGTDQRGVVRSGGVNIGAFQASASAFTVIAPAGVTAGAPFDVTVTAVDALGQMAVGYTGTLHFSSADPHGAGLPADYTFQPGDAGQVTFPAGATLYTAGTWDVTVSDAGSGIAGSANVLVTPAAADHLVFLQAPTDTAAGQTISPGVAIALVDAFGNVETSDNTDAVTLSLGVNPAGGTLSGTLTITVVNGVATFGDLSIDRPGVGYTLHATVGGSLPDIDSNPFSVTL
jgi:hypothetical protein